MTEELSKPSCSQAWSAPPGLAQTHRPRSTQPYLDGTSAWGAVLAPNYPTKIEKARNLFPGGAAIRDRRQGNLLFIVLGLGSFATSDPVRPNPEPRALADV